MNQPNLSFAKLWNISFGFLGVQIAYALQSANISRIFATLGADPHSLSYFWILPPLMGMIVQPIVGVLSDKTWCRLGRRIPYLLVGAIVAVAVMILLPNAGNFTFSQAAFLGLNAAMWFGLFSLMFLDCSINIAMQPFKMMVGDLVNEQQKGLAYSIQSFLCNVGNVVGFLFPIFFTWIGISNEAPKGVIPDSVIYSFYIGAAILVLCVLYTVLTVREMPPAEYAKYHTDNDSQENQEKDNTNIFRLLADAPRVFWTIGLVQFFCWAAFVYMWTYTNGAIAETVWHTSDAASEGYQAAGNWVGVLFAVQAVGGIAWSLIIPKFRSYRAAYVVSLILGGFGFALMPFVSNEYLLFVPYLLIGCAWAAMLALPFTILTNNIKGTHMGTYLGLFNCTICLPQIVAALCGGKLLQLVGNQANMLLVAGICLFIGAVCVALVKNER